MMQEPTAKDAKGPEISGCYFVLLLLWVAMGMKLLPLLLFFASFLPLALWKLLGANVAEGLHYLHHEPAAISPGMGARNHSARRTAGVDDAVGLNRRAEEPSP